MVDAMDEEQVRRAEVMMSQKESWLLKDPAYTLPLNGEQQEVTLLEMDDVELAYGTERSEGRGKLQITSRRLIWENKEDESKKLDVEIPCVTLHAIAKDPASYPKPCLYCQLTDGDDEDDEDAETSELYLVPQDPESLPSMFEALSRAALLNPDPPEPGEEDGDDELIFDASSMTADQSAVLDHLESVLQVTGLGMGEAAQFEDAEDGDEGGMGNGHANGHGTSMDEEEEHN